MPALDPLPPRRLALAGLGLSGLCVVSRLLAPVPLGEVHGSTEAWLMAQVQRTEWLGSYATAALVGELPNLASNPLYPALVALLSPGPEAAVVTGQLLAAASLGPALLALWVLWRRVVGGAAALAGAAALLLPAVTATALQARYDLPAVALVLGALAVAAGAGPGRTGVGRWALAGLLAGLATLCREYLGIVCVGVLGLMGAREALAGRWRGPAVAGVQVVMASTAVSLLLGLSPLAGLDNLLRYSAVSEAARPVLGEVLGPLPQRLALALGALGWLLALARPARGALLPLGALLLAFLAFLAFPQQSPQYYLLGTVLLLSGLAGLADRLPGRAAQLGGGGLIVLLGLGAGAAVAPSLVLQGSSSGTGLHSEAWSESTEHLGKVVDMVLAGGEPQPVILSTMRVENLDAFAELRHDRPVAFAFPNDLARLEDFTSAFGGADVLLALVDHADRLEEGARIEALGAPRATERWGRLRVRVWLLPGRTAAQDPCTWETTLRGVCLQRDWLRGGMAAMRAGAAARRARQPGLVRAERR